MDQRSAEKQRSNSILGEFGLQQFAPYFMNRIMGRVTAWHAVAQRFQLAEHIRPNDPYGSQAEVANHDSDVRYAPVSGSRETPVALPLCAICELRALPLLSSDRR